MKMKALIFVILVFSQLAMFSCSPENRQNSIGKEDSIRGRKPPADYQNATDRQNRDEQQAPAKAAPADNTATKQTDTTVSQP